MTMSIYIAVEDINTSRKDLSSKGNGKNKRNDDKQKNQCSQAFP